MLYRSRKESAARRMLDGAITTAHARGIVLKRERARRRLADDCQLLLSLGVIVEFSPCVLTYTYDFDGDFAAPCRRPLTLRRRGHYVTDAANTTVPDYEGRRATLTTRNTVSDYFHVRRLLLIRFPFSRGLEHGHAP